MTDDATTVAGARVFQGTAPLDADFFEERVIKGGQGAYKAILESQDRAPVDVAGSTKGDTNVLGALCFVQNKEGEARGVTLLMAGRVHLPRVSNHRFWPDAPEGFTQIHLLDMANIPTVTNKTATLFTEVNYSVSHKEAGAATYTNIPEGEWAEMGVGGLCIRRHTTAESPRGGRFYITALPVNLKQAKSLQGDTEHEDYPGINVHVGQWAWDSPEEDEEDQGVGLGHKPYIRVEGADTEGLDGVNIVDTNEIHARCRTLVHDGGPPNTAKHAAGWRTKVDAGQAAWKVVFVSTKRRYPAPRDEPPSPVRTAGAGATAGRGESRNSLTNQHDNRSAQIAGLGGGEIKLSLGFS